MGTCKPVILLYYHQVYGRGPQRIVQKAKPVLRYSPNSSGIRAYSQQTGQMLQQKKPNVFCGDRTSVAVRIHIKVPGSLPDANWT